MSVSVLCSSCRDGNHDRCEVGYTLPGVIGGWTCNCTDPVCLGERRKKRWRPADESGTGDGGS